jgi:hypothetical protein
LNSTVSAKKRYLAGSSYGQGWSVCYIFASSAEAITHAYPELQILDETEFYARQRGELREALRENMEKYWTYDIDDPPVGLLKALIDERRKNP